MGHSPRDNPVMALPSTCRLTTAHRLKVEYSTVHRLWGICASMCAPISLAEGDIRACDASALRDRGT